MKTLEGILAKHPFFGRVDPRCHQLVIGCASNVRFNAGEFIMSRQDSSSVMCVTGHVASPAIVHSSRIAESTSPQFRASTRVSLGVDSTRIFA